MKGTIPLLCVIFIAISLALSGCITPNVPEDENSGSTPADDDTVPTPTPTPIPTRMQLSGDATPTPTDNDTDDDDKSTWDICDPRHNASWLYMHGCMGGGSSAGGSGPNSVHDPIPEIATIGMIISGIILLAMFCRRKK